MIHFPPRKLLANIVQKNYTKNLPEQIRLLSFNIQLGINTKQYHHYVTRSWQHILPHSQRQDNLKKIASILHNQDIVALQEVDGGSFRSGFVNQIEYIAQYARFPYWYQQLNRNFGRLAQHSNGILTKIVPKKINDYPLPGLPGRGAITLEIGENNQLIIVAMHLALGQRRQSEQLSYIKNLVKAYQYIILMGDMNSNEEQLLFHSPLKKLNLKSATPEARTFPSWKPVKGLDHILVSKSLDITSVAIPKLQQSDHLPVSVTLRFPSTQMGQNNIIES